MNTSQTLRLNLQYGLKDSKEKPRLLGSLGMMFGRSATSRKKADYADELEVNEFMIDPHPSDLSDLFNYDFNEPNSCFHGGPQIK